MIEVGRNSIIVRDVDLESAEFKKANYYFSVYSKVEFKYTMSAFTIIDKDLYFPSSITVEKISRYFPDKKIVYNYASTAKSKQIRFNMKHNPRDEIQKKALLFLLNMEKDNFNRERFLSLATGTGKTYVTINFISKIRKRALIIVDTLSLAAQWKREFLTHSDLKDDDIRLLSGSESIEEESKKSNGKIYIAIHKTLGSMLSEDSNSVNRLMNKLCIGIRVFDESHVDFRNICSINALSNVEYTIFLSATPSRSRFLENNLYSKVFKSIPYFNGKEISNNKYHTVVITKFNSNPTLDVKFSIKTKYGFNIPKWSNYIANDAYNSFSEAIITLFLKMKLIERKKKIVIVLPTLELINKLKETFLKSFPKLDVGIFIGATKKEERLIQLNKLVILTNDKIFDKGLDVKNLEILINCVPFGSSVKLEQIMGRLRYNEEKASIYIDLYDEGFAECRSQLKLRKTFYRKRAKKIIEIENKQDLINKGEN